MTPASSSTARVVTAKPQRKQGPERRGAEDEGEAATEPRAGAIAPVADQGIVARLDEPRGEEKRPDDREREEGLDLGVLGGRVVEEEPEPAALGERLSAEAARRVEEPGAERKAGARSGIRSAGHGSAVPANVSLRPASSPRGR